MKAILLLALALITKASFAQIPDSSSSRTTPKVDIYNTNPLNSDHQKDASNGASDYFAAYTRTAKTGLILNIAGTALTFIPFISNSTSIKVIQSCVLGGTALNLAGFILQAAALSQIDKASIKLYYLKTSLLINGNGVGLKFTMP